MPSSNSFINNATLSNTLNSSLNRFLNDSTTPKLAPHQSQDAYFMMSAIEQAQKGIYTTRPNPAVGCVIVKNNQIIGSGFHPKAGQPHAEVFALRDAGAEALEATAYVTLEPCSHTGRTPPCAEALIKAGVKRVVVAGLDPNPKVAGRGIKMLIEAGIEVSVGVATEQAEQLNQGFLKAMRTNKPYVRLKTATSLDGRTAMASGESKWITGNAAREDVQKLRALSGAIITGSQTVIDDNPSLNVRSSRLGVSVSEIPQPKVVVLDRRKRLVDKVADYGVLQRDNTLLYFESDLDELLRTLVSDFQIHDVLIEAGSQVSATFIEQDLVDELIVYQAPCLLGSEAKPMLSMAIDELAMQKRFRINSLSQIGNDIKISLLSISHGE